jgi:NADH-quinone oxidoreductase subunit J
VLYTKYAYPFELAAVLLLVAIVAAIALTMRKRPNLKIQDVDAQNAVRAKDRVRILKMEVTKDEPAPTGAAAGTPEKGA